MATDKQLQHVMDLAKRRKLTPRPIAKSEAAMTDAARLKREEEAKRAASMWAKGMDRETRK